MLANKNKNYQIKETEQDDYHLLLTRKEIDFTTLEVKKIETVQVFDPKGFKQFKEFKPEDIKGVEILHDPTYKPAKENAK